MLYPAAVQEFAYPFEVGEDELFEDGGTQERAAFHGQVFVQADVVGGKIFEYLGCDTNNEVGRILHHVFHHFRFVVPGVSEPFGSQIFTGTPEKSGEVDILSEDPWAVAVFPFFGELREIFGVASWVVNTKAFFECFPIAAFFDGELEELVHGHPGIADGAFLESFADDTGGTAENHIFVVFFEYFVFEGR